MVLQASLFDNKKICEKCICTACKERFGTIPIQCKHSDCIWCIDEAETYTKACRHYIERKSVYEVE